MFNFGLTDVRYRAEPNLVLVGFRGRWRRLRLWRLWADDYWRTGKPLNWGAYGKTPIRLKEAGR